MNLRTSADGRQRGQRRGGKLLWEVMCADLNHEGRGYRISDTVETVSLAAFAKRAPFQLRVSGIEPSGRVISIRRDGSASAPASDGQGAAHRIFRSRVPKSYWNF